MKMRRGLSLAPFCFGFALSAIFSNAQIAFGANKALTQEAIIEEQAAEIKKLKSELTSLTTKVASVEATVASIETKATQDHAASAPSGQRGSSGKQGIGEDSTSSGTKNNISTISEGFDVPNSPAAAVLGISQDKVQHIRTPKQFIPALINGVDEHGHFQSGLTVDFAPYQVLMGDRAISEFRGGQYGIFGSGVTDYLQRVLLRTQISMGATKGASDGDKSSKFAFGIHSVLANADDPIMTADLAAIRSKLPMNPWVMEDSDSAGKFANALLTHASWSVGAAPSWIAPDQNGNHYDYNGTTAWSSFAYVPGPDTPYRFLLDVLYHQGEKISAADAISTKITGSSPSSKGMISQNSVSVVSGIRFGRRDWNATASGGWIHLDQPERGQDQTFRFALETEYLIPGSNSWLTLSISKDAGHQDGRNQTLVLGGYKIGFGGADFSLSHK